MRGLLALVGMIFSLIPVLGYLAFDYSMSNRAARAMGESEISFGAYVMGWADMIEIVGTGVTEPGATAMPGDLVAMLPKAPEGWVQRAMTPQDLAAVLGLGLAGEDLGLASDALQDNGGKGLDQARMAYDSPAGVVVAELVRYPDTVFTSFMAMSVKFELEMKTMSIQSSDFMTVRGFEVRRAALPKSAPVQVLLGDLGGQLHLRVTAPATMADTDLVPFFQTLHVPAMNAAIVRPVPGMGEVPVVVLASVLDDQTRIAFAAEQEAARAAAAEAKKAQEDEAKAKLMGTPAADPVTTLDEGAPEDAPPAAAPEASETAEAPSEVEVKVNRNDQKKAAPKKEPGMIGGPCREEGGRKICGLGD